MQPRLSVEITCEGISLESYSTATVHVKERVDYWQDLCSRTYAALELIPRDHRNFEGTLRRSFAGPFAFVRVSSSAASITRSEEHVMGSAGHRFDLFLTLRGSSLCFHNGQRSLLTAGDFTLVDLSLPYRFEFEDVCSAVSIGMPQSLLRSYLPVPGEFLCRPMSGVLGANRLAAVMIECLCDQVQSGNLGEVGPSLIRGVLDVVATAYASASGVPPSQSTSARRVQIRAFIEANLRDPHLTPRHIASALGISPRYLRLLFSQADETISQYITRRRIEEIARRLTESIWRGTTITEIAYDWGFSDAAHFARLFRDRFGVSPRRYRQGQCARG